jgi:hypothetical protein
LRDATKWTSGRCRARNWRLGPGRGGNWRGVSPTSWGRTRRRIARARHRATIEPNRDKNTRGEPSDSAARPRVPAKNKAGKRPGKQPGAPGRWRSQPLIANGQDAEHYPPACDCGATPAIERQTRQISARHLCDLERGDKGLQVTIVKHCYFAIAWNLAVILPISGMKSSSNIPGIRCAAGTHVVF